MQVRFLGQEDPLEEGMATHSSVLAWRIPGMVEPDGLPSMESHSQTRLKRLSSSSSSSSGKEPACQCRRHKRRGQALDREDPLEEEMVNHSSILAWRIPWTEEPGGLQSIGSQRVGHD